MLLRDVGEFGLIERIERLAGESRGGSVVLGIGDDAAVLRPRAGHDVVVTTDSLVEEVHFRFGEETARALGRRALVANFSDLAAMGARPTGFLLSLSAPPSLALRTALDVVRGMIAEGARCEAPLVGGNVARARRVQMHVTALGEVRRGRALRRDAGRAGDRLLVTGVLGASALARARVEHSGGRLRHRPSARIAAGRALAALPDAGACIDVSDGLLADLGHLVRASGVGADLDPEAVPRPRGLAAACRRLGLDPQALTLAGGEDCELLFSVRPGAPSTGGLSRRLGLPVAEIGRLTPKRGIRVAGRPAGARRGGWRHF